MRESETTLCVFAVHEKLPKKEEEKMKRNKFLLILGNIVEVHALCSNEFTLMIYLFLFICVEYEIHMVIPLKIE